MGSSNENKLHVGDHRTVRKRSTKTLIKLNVVHPIDSEGSDTDNCNRHWILNKHHMKYIPMREQPMRDKPTTDGISV
jgi:hypothetical protein